MSYPTIYVGLFWLDSAQVVAHKIASLDKTAVIEAVCDYLARLQFEDAKYAEFVAKGARKWNGTDTEASEVPGGRIVMFSTPLEGDDSRMT